MIPSESQIPQAIPARPEPRPVLLRFKRRQRRDDRRIGISGWYGRANERGPRESNDPAGRPHGARVLLDQACRDSPPHGPHYSFRLTTSLIATFSSAMSVYITLRRPSRAPTP